ncbi:unnamed protein product [Schistosoma margrebowiei]|uniref:Uncharacterized protein n=1 Tax=Schistosoma margrebowiei TaxID=48269 RepID=A0A183MJ24_9TREM|nr:unnamed protein product [Schistosoma margrebowiei]
MMIMRDDLENTDPDYADHNLLELKFMKWSLKPKYIVSQQMVLLSESDEDSGPRLIKTDFPPSEVTAVTLKAL